MPLFFCLGHVNVMTEPHQPINRIPEPLLPEHQMLRDVATMPQLSRGLRERVIVDVRRQVRFGWWSDRLRIAAAALAACALICLVWNFRWTGQTQVAERPAAVPEPQISAPSKTGSLSASDTMPKDEATPVLPQGGPANRPEMKELQQLNRLIEDIQGRNNVLCGTLSLW